MKTINQYITEHMFSGKKVTVKNQQTGYVDLALPSGTKWAICNVGANSPEEYGDFFAWGEIKSKERYTEENYTSNNTISEKNDVAYQTTNGTFRIPTLDEFKELFTETTWSPALLKSIKGMQFVSKENKDKWIFIPFTGWKNYEGSPKATDSIWCWTSTTKKQKPYVAANYYGKNVSEVPGYIGCTVRGVLNDK